MLKASKIARSGEHGPLSRDRVPDAKGVRVQEAPVRQRKRLLGAVEMISENGVADRVTVQALRVTGTRAKRMGEVLGQRTPNGENRCPLVSVCMCFDVCESKACSLVVLSSSGCWHTPALGKRIHVRLGPKHEAQALESTCFM